MAKIDKIKKDKTLKNCLSPDVLSGKIRQLCEVSLSQMKDEVETIYKSVKVYSYELADNETYALKFKQPNTVAFRERISKNTWAYALEKKYRTLIKVYMTIVNKAHLKPSYQPYFLEINDFSSELTEAHFKRSFVEQIFLFC